MSYQIDLKCQNEQERKNSTCARAVLIGPFRLKLETGEDITPGSPLRQAILAVLITAPEQTKSRKTIQEMFWGSAGSARSSANLRTALYLLKKDLLRLGKDIIMSDRLTISLTPGYILATSNIILNGTFLEGIDLPLEDCELFEDWLREMRSGYAEEAINQTIPSPKSIERIKPSRLALGLLPSFQAGTSHSDLLRSDSILDSIIRFVIQTTTIDVHDLRSCDTQAVPLPIESGKGATHFLQTLVERRGGRLSVNLRLYESSSRCIIWVSNPIDALIDGRMELVSDISETLLERMAACPAAEASMDLFPWTALTALFSLDDDIIAKTETQINHMLQSNQKPELECLHIFAQVFKVNEGVALPERITTDDLRELISSIPSTHPMLPLCESLVGYSAHMLLGDNDLAEMLIDHAAERAPNLALNLDHLAVIKLMRGDIDGADTAFKSCLRSGASSPWRYTYDITGAMISMAKGDFRQSLFFANRALLRKPRFIGALRYAMVGLALSDKIRDAQRMHARIRRLRPGYDFSEWTDSMMRRTSTRLGAKIAKSLQANGFV